MRKSLKLISLALGVVILLGVVGVGAAFAADPPTTPTDYHNAFLAKLATLLGIDEQKLSDAYTKALTETRDEMIDQAVKDGWITQARADWLKQMPDVGTVGPGFGGGWHGGKFGGRMGGYFGGPWAQSTPAPAQ